MNRTARLAVAIAGAALLLGALDKTDKTNPSSPTTVDFEQRVANYLKLHQAAEDELHRLKPTKSDEAIQRHEHELGEHIRRMRQHAAQGDIFTPEIAAEFRRLIGQTMQGPEAAAIRASLLHAEPIQVRGIRVNGNYPQKIPLQSTPPSLLENLPALSSQLEYRLDSHTLILLDVEANLIVDFVPNALP